MTGGVEVAPKVDLFGVPVDAYTEAGALAALQRMIATGRPHLVFSFNVDICMQAGRDAELLGMLKAADLIMVDGTPMVWAARLLGTPVPARLSGSDLVPVVCAMAAAQGYRVYLLGGLPGVAERAAVVLQAHYPRLQIVGTDAPPFGFDQDPEENGRVIERIRAVAPHVLFVALGAPKEQRWLTRHRSALNVPVSMGVGSSLDYLAGRLRRAPVWMQRLALEWVFRLAQEPRRLWRRYLLRDLPFAYYLAREIIRQRWRNCGWFPVGR